MRNPRGYVALLAVLVVGAIGIAVVTSVLLLGLGASRTSAAVERSDQAKGLANACAEEGLREIRASFSFTGGAGLSFGNGSCTYTVTSGTGPRRTVQATGTAGTVIRKVEVEVRRQNPLIVIDSWQEVADF
jgi:hypothetical protein